MVVFGTGGSGTRVIARIVRHAGCFLGRNLNVSDDSLDLADFFDRWINPYLLQCRWIDSVLAGTDSMMPSPQNAALMIQDFQQTMIQHRIGFAEAGGRWGWKEPRSIYLLPFLREQYPGMVGIHVVRDGRDMAYSANQNQLAKHGSSVLTEPQLKLPLPVQSLTLWSKVNLAAAIFGERFLDGQYLRVRFDDLCANPAGVVAEIFGFLGVAPGDTPQIRAAVAEVNRPGTIGRWRASAGNEMAELTGHGEGALREFGYLTGDG